MTTTTTAPAKSRTVLPRPLVYKESDGKPMAETDKHRRVMMYLIEALTLYFANLQVYVSGNNFIHYREGDTRAHISPDVYVVFGRDNHTRDSYKVWEEGDHTPAVAFEITSRSTQGEDTGRKRRIYEQVLRVPEYFLFDPTGDYLSPRLQGYRLDGERYVALELEGDRLHSAELGLELIVADESVRLYDAARDSFLPTLLEEHQARLQAEERAERLAARLRELGLTEEEL